jgi:glycine hydroxymethyltransferase
MYDLESRINAAVFPGHQGGPHNHTITALAVALKQAQSSEFREYQTQVLKNCKAMADGFLSKGYKLVSGGTDNHLILIDLKPNKVDGAKVEKVLELANVALNKNTVPGDKSAMVPGGVRLGTPAVTTRGMVEGDMKTIVDFVDRGVDIAIDIQSKLPEGSKKMKDFQNALQSGSPKIDALKSEVTTFARQFPTIGF